QVFDGGFLDDKIAAFYRDDERLSALCKGFALLAILISCLGLYGLASLLAVQKTKEIGVRKVLGASVGSVVALLSKDFLLLVLLAAILAIPAAWWAMSRWLQEFVYRAPLSVWIFAGTVGLSALVAFLTVGLQTWKAARVNPVKSLRSE
ncbi:MAG TPA: FtsX-like permease family protein, partial [Saprospiraceae bacterium]|nr:FtsX-like permease family protein [Saprospiraceae bacterium]